MAVSPFPRLYTAVAREANLSHVCMKRVWHIRRGPLAGFKLTDVLPDEIWPVLTNSMEIHCSNLLAQLPLASGIALDVGGSYGYYALLLSRTLGEDGLVYSFEPDWPSFGRLIHNLAINNVRNVIPVPICVSDSPTSLVHWQSHEDRPWDSHLADDRADSDTPSPIVVPVTSLDHFADALDIGKRIRLIKIDVEGAELKVLKGATALLHRVRPLVICELHGSEIAKQVFAFVAENDYQWEMIEYMSETRQHILAFPAEQSVTYRSQLAAFKG